MTTEPSTTDRKPTWQSAIESPWAWLAAAFVFVLSVMLVTRTVAANLTADLTRSGGTFWDFRDAGYFPVRAVLDGVIPYDVDQYFALYPVGQEFPLLPPTYMVLHAPFQLLSAHGASVAMFALNLVGIVALSAWSLRLARYRIAPVALLSVSALAIVSNGGRNVLHSGQASLLFAAGAYLAMTAPGTVAGAAGVFTTLIKPGIGLPLTILLAAAGGFKRALIGAATAGVVSFVLMLPFVVWAGGVVPLVDLLRENAAFSADSIWVSLETTTARLDIAATFAMLSDAAPPQWVEIALAALVIGGGATVLFRKRKTLAMGTNWDAAIVMICLATVTSLYHSFYDLGILLLPIVLLSRKDFAGGMSQRLRIPILAALLVASFNPFRIDAVIHGLSLSPRALQILSPGLTGLSLLVALVLVGVLILRINTPIGRGGDAGDVPQGIGHFATAESRQDSTLRSTYDDGVRAWDGRA